MDTPTSTKISVKLLDPACMPQRKTTGAVGYDLVAREGTVLMKGEIGLIPVGFAVELPPGTEAQIRGRSSLNARGVLALFGTIDSDYRGEVKVLLLNMGILTGFTVNKGDRIAQMVVAEVLPTELVEAPVLAETDRGEGGFGSTDAVATLQAVVATEEEIAKVQETPSVQEAIWAENQMKAARDWQNAHDPFFGGTNSGTDS